MSYFSYFTCPTCWTYTGPSSYTKCELSLHLKPQTFILNSPIVHKFPEMENMFFHLMKWCSVKCLWPVDIDSKLQADSDWWDMKFDVKCPCVEYQQRAAESREHPPCSTIHFKTTSSSDVWHVTEPLLVLNQQEPASAPTAKTSASHWGSFSPGTAWFSIWVQTEVFN